MQNQIPKNWQKVKLGELIDINPKQIGINYPYDDIEYIDISSVGIGVLETATQYKLSEAPGRAKRLVKDGDTIISTVRPNRRSFLFIKQPKDNLVVSTGFAVLSPKTNITDPKFLYYLITRQSFTDYLSSNVRGSAYPAISTDVIENAEVQIPDYAEQKQIASMLSSLDDKIEVNNKIAKTLEEMVQVLFKEWFVQFKFPGYEKVEFIDSELGKIPKSWQIGTLEDLVNIRNGFAFKSTDYNDAGVPIVRTMNFTDNGSVELDDTVFLSADVAKKYDNFYLATFDFLLVMVGASVGKWSIVPSNILPALQNQNMWDFMPKKEEHRFFNISLLKKLIREQRGSTTGSARDFFRKDYFYSLKIFIPSSEILQKFNNLVVPIYKRLDKILSENQKLSAVRDLLLPKLMKGEIRI